MFLDQSIEDLPHTRPITKKKLKKIGINTYWDLLNHFPFRHEDYSRITKINGCREEETVTVIGRVVAAKNRYLRGGMTVQEVILADETGEITVNWFNQPYLSRLFPVGSRVAIGGETTVYNGLIKLKPRQYEVLKDGCLPIHTQKIIPVYPATSGLSSRTIRAKIFYLLNELKQDLNHDELKDFLPPEIIASADLIDEKEAYHAIHFPPNQSTLAKAKKRLAFDELFLIQLSSELTKKRWSTEKLGCQLKFGSKEKKFLSQFVDRLPFKLTKAQNTVLREIIADLTGKKAMNRFLQGDVGSGKTVVAALAAYLTHLNGYQTLFMVPTEILANQHYQNLTQIFDGTGLRLGLQTSGHRLKKKANNYDLIIGTQALIQEKVKLDKVGLVIIDEQQRFGVRQRAILKAKGINPHLLTMTATPIPRTVALTLYGELSMSVIDEMPKGRQTVKTYLVPQKKREAAYQWIKEMVVKKKNQVFVVCPLIEESSTETMKSVKAAKQEYNHLAKVVYPDLKIGLIHGRMKTKEKQTVMANFKNSVYQILVSTSVIEVGIDISQARIIVIEGAERYGLAQLHQLRGRVGRDHNQSYCLIFTNASDSAVLDRLRYFAATKNGFDLAEYDFKKRGPGAIFGTKQHGYLNLNIASLFDEETIKEAQKAKEIFMAKFDLKDWPGLKKRLQRYRQQLIARD